MAAAVVWAGTLPLAAGVASGAAGSRTAGVVAAVPYAIGAVICHQLPARSFHLGTQPLPVCARCTGLYVGAAIAAVLAAIGTAAPVRRARAVLALAALPTIVTLAYEWSTADAPSNITRAVTALPLGAAIAFVVLTRADDRVN